MRSCFQCLRLSVVLLCLLCCLSGCGSTPSVSREGSNGLLTFGAQTLGDICVVVHRKEGTGFQQQGFGTTDRAGFFHLLRDGGQEPLVLEPGDYSFTLESVGPQIVFPAPYLKPETSPLKVTWTAELTTLDLQAPEELLAKLPK